MSKDNSSTDTSSIEEDTTQIKPTFTSSDTDITHSALQSKRRSKVAQLQQDTLAALNVDSNILHSGSRLLRSQKTLFLSDEEHIRTQLDHERLVDEEISFRPRRAGQTTDDRYAPTRADFEYIYRHIDDLDCQIWASDLESWLDFINRHSLTQDPSLPILDKDGLEYPDLPFSLDNLLKLPITVTDNRLSSLSPIHSIDTDDEIEEIQPVSKDDIEDNDNYNTPPSNTPPPTSMTQQDTTQTQTSHRLDIDMSEYIKCPRFQEKFKSIKTDLGTDICNAIAREPEKMRNWFLQVIHAFPDLLDDKCGPTVQYIATDRGFIQINQPSYDVTFEPDTTQTEQNPEQDDTQQEKCQDQSEVTQASQPPMPRSDSSEEKDDIDSSDDCVIQEVTPPPQKRHSAETPPTHRPKTKGQLKSFPEGAAREILLQLPNGEGKFYTVTALLEPQTAKRHRPRDNSPEPSTSTGTTTESGHSKKKKKKKKKSRKD